MLDNPNKIFLIFSIDQIIEIYLFIYLFLSGCMHQISFQWFVAGADSSGFRDGFVKKTPCIHFPTCEGAAQGLNPTFN
jgi:hypothetical protein